jgi:hypothetical protein
MKFNLLLLLLLPVMTSAHRIALDAKSGTIVLKRKIGVLDTLAELWVYKGEEKWDTVPIKDGKFNHAKITKLPAYGAMVIKYKPYCKGQKSSSGFFSNLT